MLSSLAPDHRVPLDSATQDQARYPPATGFEESSMPEGTTRTARRRLLADAPSPASVYLDVVNTAWETSKFPGIQHKVLYTDPDSGMSTILFKLSPGAVVPLHEHTGVEMTYVLEGSLEDEEGACTAGNFVWRPAGNTHEAAAPHGAVILGIFMKPNHFAAGQRFFTETQSG
jgi:quercetin dioxygenase-like cupin family protein